MNNENLYEKSRIKDRFRDLATLAGFTVAVAILSVVVMDLLVYPLAVAATRNTEVFTALIKYTIVILPVLAVMGMQARRIVIMRREGIPGRTIAAILARRPLYHLAVFFIILLFTVLIAGALYLLLGYNYYLLYRLSI
ncbi:MAG: hypothetical protein JXA20_12585 [Spirochaetes bacterium]|nr:hypothetical protein [Spirochaetota bacterium]